MNIKKHAIIIGNIILIIEYYFSSYIYDEKIKQKKGETSCTIQEWHINRYKLNIVNISNTFKVCKHCN